MSSRFIEDSSKTFIYSECSCTAVSFFKSSFLLFSLIEVSITEVRLGRFVPYFRWLLQFLLKFYVKISSFKGSPSISTDHTFQHICFKVGCVMLLAYFDSQIASLIPILLHGVAPLQILISFICLLTKSEKHTQRLRQDICCMRILFSQVQLDVRLCLMWKRAAIALLDLRMHISFEFKFRSGCDCFKLNI